MLEPDTIKKVKIKKNPIKIYLGDCLKKLDSMKDNSIDCVITDPPYFIDKLDNKWDSKKVKNPLPMKYSLINFRSIVLCLETSINPHKIQKGNIAHIPIFINRKIVLRNKGISKINLKMISIKNFVYN